MASGAAARGVQHGAGRRDRQIFAVRPPAAGDQPFAAAAANEGWLCVVRPGNIGCHGDDKGFGEHMFLRGEDRLMTQTLRDRRESHREQAEDPMPNLFARAASMLLGDRPEDAGAPMSGCCCEALGYARDEFPARCRASDSETHHRARLLKAASRFVRVFELAAPDAPGLVALRRRIRSGDCRSLARRQSRWSAFPASGFRCRKRFRDASARASNIFPSCRPGTTCCCRPVPAIRLPSSVRRRGTSSPRSRRTACARMLSFHGTPPGGSPIGGRGLAAGGSVSAPAAGPARDRAAISVEHRIGRRHVLGRRGLARHARIDRARRGQPLVAGRQPRRIDPAAARGPHHGRGAAGAAAAKCFGAAELVARYNDGYRRALRRCRLLQRGRLRFCLRPGCAADTRGRGPLRHPGNVSARTGLCGGRGEVPRARGSRAQRAGPGPSAARHHDRRGSMPVAATGAGAVSSIWPSTPPIRAPCCGSSSDRLEQFGIETFALDLTRPRFAIPVARVIAPGLQPEPSEIITPRLADMIAQTGGGCKYTGGVALI